MFPFASDRALRWRLAAILLALMLVAQYARSAPSLVLRTTRPRDTVVTSGTYQVHVQRLGGPEIESGSLHYEVFRDGQVARSGEADLSRDREGAWTADIPAQDAGATVRYHFAIRTREGDTVRRPARAEAWYQFEVRALLIVPTELPSERNDWQLAIRISGGLGPRGEVVARYGSGEVRRIELAPTVSVEAGRVLQARLPLERGDAVDYRVIVADGEERARWPGGTPERWASVKRSVGRVRPVAATSAPVAGITSVGDEVWIALDGGGLERYANGRRSGAWRVGDGLPSNQVRRIVTEAPATRFLAGTERGIRVVYPESGATVAIYPRGPDDVTASQAADIVLVSPLDGSALFQLEPHDGDRGRRPTRWQIVGDRLELWEPRRGEELTWEAGIFDADQGCFLLATIVGSRGVVAQRICGDMVETFEIPTPAIEQGELSPIQIVSLAKMPASDRITAALVARVRTPSGSRPVSGFLVFDGARSPGDDLGVAFVPLEEGVTPTALATDDRRSRLLLGTNGQGIVVWTSGSFFTLSSDPRLRTVTSLEIEPTTGTLLVGTPSLGFRLDEDGGVRESFGATADVALPRDGLPVQVKGGRALVVSASEGIVELDASRDLSILRRLVPGRELPKGRYGAAVYGASDDILVILDGRSLLRIDDSGRSQLLEGLEDSEPHSLFVSRTDELWVSFWNTGREAPAGARRFRYDAERLSASGILNEAYGTVTDWMDAPESSGVWAATKAGVVLLDADRSERLSRFSVASIAANARGNLVAVGAAIQRWDGQGFHPIPFRVEHPRRPPGGYSPGDPFDVAIDAEDRLLTRHSTGTLVVADRAREAVHVLDAEDGVPPSARTSTYIPGVDAFLCGSAAEGMVRIQLPSVLPR